MGSAPSFSCVVFYNKMFPSSSHFDSQTKITYQPLSHILSSSKNLPHSAYASCAFQSFQAFLAKKSRGTVVRCVQRSWPGPDDHRAVETVLKLYAAIKNKNFNDLSDVIGEECLCICNFVSSFQPFRGKEQVLAFFSSLMKRLGNNIEFVVQPVFHDGLNVGVSWKLEWKETQIPIGKGFSFYTCHVYQGKVVIKNMEMLLEPIFHIEPIRLKLLTSLANTLDNVSSCAQLKCMQITGVLKILLLIFLLLAVIFSFLR